MTHSIPANLIFLRLLGIPFLLFSWLTVLRPQLKVYWGRGANRPLISRKGRLAFAIAMTGWCLGVFGADQTLALGLFATGFAAAFIYAREDAQRHLTRNVVTAIENPTPRKNSTQ